MCLGCVFKEAALSAWKHEQMLWHRSICSTVATRHCFLHSAAIALRHCCCIAVLHRHRSLDKACTQAQRNQSTARHTVACATERGARSQGQCYSCSEQCQISCLGIPWGSCSISIHSALWHTLSKPGKAAKACQQQAQHPRTAV